MALYIPNAGELRLLDFLLNVTNNTRDYTLKLYKNNYTPIATTTSSSFTEATFTGYSAITLTRENWGNATTVDGKAESTYDTLISWTCGATGDTIYGYWVEDASDNCILWAEKFTNPRILQENDILNLTAKFTLSTETP
jgi:hypothetical protein